MTDEKKPSPEEQRQQLEDIKFLIRNNADKIKPLFGVMFWELADIEKRISPEEFARQGMQMTMQESDDEVLASFMGSYVNLWMSAGDLTAASRFVADCLSMSADELLQTRSIYLAKPEA